MRQVLFIVSFLLSSILNAQQGNVEVIKDERVNSFVRQRALIVPPATSPQMTGYRIQLIFDSNKELIDNARSKVVSSYPKIDTYVNYNPPHFVLKVGDFRTKQEAERVKSALVRDFPTCFVIKELINLPRID